MRREGRRSKRESLGRDARRGARRGNLGDLMQSASGCYRVVGTLHNQPPEHHVCDAIELGISPRPRARAEERFSAAARVRPGRPTPRSPWRHGDYEKWRSQTT